ncbi:hypothetical protein B0H13DRAFT_1891685 [Mycena leptocephala]|nr:hypothetical protein B0H13DRAFT_1891685 [Mycena leptocephala]
MTIPDDEDDTMIMLSSAMLGMDPSCAVGGEDKKYSKLFDDIFYRPRELEGMCAWDILRDYTKEKKPKSKTQRNVYLSFQPGHPQFTTHCLKKLESTRVIPVLQDYHVPQNDLENDNIKYAVVIIALFRPWSSCKTSPLKSPDLNWLDSLAELQVSMSPEHVRVTLNMQLLYQTRDAKFDFTAKRGKRLAEMMRRPKIQVLILQKKVGMFTTPYGKCDAGSC